MSRSPRLRNGFSITAHHDFHGGTTPVLLEYISEIAKTAERDVGKYDSHEHALLLPLDTNVLEEAKSAAKRHANDKVTHIIVIGIGGSNLGTKAVYDALYGAYALALSRTPKLLFLDTLSNDATTGIQTILEQEVKHSGELLINLISKSGTTVESVANFELLYQALEKRFPDIASRVVVTTDVDSALWVEGKRRGFGLLPIPGPVGGRYSVFSPVGIFPLLLAGVDVDQFCEGGRDMFQVITSPDQDKNQARVAAEELFAAMGMGCTMLNIFHFNPGLESLGKWERQLIAESLGKEKNLGGKIVHAGITPIVSIGSTDLHSMAQLYLGGPRDKFTMLIRADEKTAARIPRTELVKGISQQSPGEIMEAIYGGVIGAYQGHQLPFLEVRLPGISPYVLGAYMEWRMGTVMYLAKLMNVNAFDQPNVEDYKKVTREILQSVVSSQ